MKKASSLPALLALVLGWGVLWDDSARAQVSPLPDFTVPDGMVRRDFPLGMADLQLVEQLCRETLSEGGKFHILRTSRTLRVIDKPGAVETIRQMLPHISQPPPNVKIEFISREVSSEPVRGVDVRGRVFDRRGGGAIEVDILNQDRRGSSLSRQFIMVRAGNEGFIEVAREVPMIDEFTRFVADGNFGAMLGLRPQVFGNNTLFPLATGRFEVPEFRWEKAGSRLVVRPTIEGNLIHLHIMPQISSIVIVDPEALRRRGLNTWLTGREQYVTYTRMETMLTVRSGEEIVVGGFEKATPGFNRAFQGGNLSIRATIQ